MKTRNIPLSVILLSVLALLFACATAKSQYSDARTIDTISAYQEFLGRYPTGEYAELAQNRIEGLNFENAKTVNSVPAYQRFIDTSTSDLFKNYAQQRIQMIYRDEYLKAKEIDTVQAYEKHLATYPQSDYLKDCRLRIEYLEWSRAIKRNNAAGYYRYLNNCKSCGQHDQEAQTRFANTVRLGIVTDLPVAKNRIQKIIHSKDIVVTQTRAGNMTAKTGSARLKDLATADEVLVSRVKAAQTISAADLAKGNYASVKLLRLTDRVPIDSENPLGFSTVIYYPEKSGPTDVLFIVDGRGYLFRETDSDIY